MADDAVRVEIASLLDPADHDFDAQYRAATDAVAVIDRSYLERVSARGKDSATFLHNMLSADINKLGPGAGARATFLTNKGKLVSSLSVFHDGERVLLEMESTNVRPLTEAISRYIISEDVTLENLADVSFSLEGARAAELAAELTGVDKDAIDLLSHLSFLSREDTRLTARRKEPSPRFDIAASWPKAAELITLALQRGAVPASALVAETRRIEAGRPRFGIDADTTHMPLEASLDDAVSFDKGCYIGQEYVVRLAHRGHLNKKLVGIVLESEPNPEDVPRPGAPVTADDESVGELTSAAYSPARNAIVALGYVRKEFFEPGSVVRVDGRTGVVAALPFV